MRWNFHEVKTLGIPGDRRTESDVHEVSHKRVDTYQSLSDSTTATISNNKFFWSWNWKDVLFFKMLYEYWAITAPRKRFRSMIQCKTLTCVRMLIKQIFAFSPILR